METSAGVVAELDLGCPLTSLCLSPNLQYCAVGARDVVKVLDLGPEGFAEVKTLSITTKGSIKFSITDVSWSAMDSGLVAAAMNNGGIVVWDVVQNRRPSFHAGSDVLGGMLTTQLPSHHSERVMVEHQRTVNRVAWHPSEPALLLSCSMDNSIKLWDRRGRTHHCAVTFRPRSEAVRDVQFSPFQPHRFAAAFENGQLQVWDRRKVSQPQLKIMAHSQPIMAIDWHPMRDWVIATGSRDRTVCAWSLATCTWGDGRAQSATPLETVHCPAPVGRVKWRPGHLQQVAVAGVAGDADVCIFDVTQPYVPVVVLEGKREASTGLSWCDTPLPLEFAGGAIREASAAPFAPLSPHLHRHWEAESTRLNEGSGMTGGTAGAGGWGGGWTWGGPAAGQSGSPAARHVFAGVWQHVVVCSKDGKVRLHSLPRSLRPRDSISPCAFGLSPCGGLAQIHDRVDWAPKEQGFYRDEVTDLGLGIFREPGNASWASPAQRGKHMDRSTKQRRLQGSATRGPSTSPAKLGKNKDRDAQHDTNVGGSSSGGGDASSIATWADDVRARMHSGGSPLLSAAQRPSDAASAGVETLDGDHPSYAGAHARPRAILTVWSPGADGSDSAAADVGGLAPAVVRVLADGYVMRGGRVRDLCMHNAGVAVECGLPQLASAWRIVQILLDGACLEPQQDDVNYKQHHAGGTQDTLSGGNALDHMKTSYHNGEEGVEEDFDFTMPEALALLEDQEGGIAMSPDGEATLVHPGPDQATKVSSPHGTAEATSRGAPVTWLWRSALADFLQERSEQGDVLHCVVICEIVHGWYTQRSPASGSPGKEGSSTLPRESVHEATTAPVSDNDALEWCELEGVTIGMVREWYASYILVLRHLGLVLAATDLIRHAVDPWICAQTMQGTVVHASCARCRAPSGPSARCEKCAQALSRCALCEQPVRSLYVWCPGCGHGGHLHHMHEWFTQASACPTGCGHHCNLNLVLCEVP